MIITNETVYCIQKSALPSFKLTLDKVYHPYISKIEILQEKGSTNKDTKGSKDPKIHVVVESIANYDFIHIMPRIEHTEKRPKLNDKQKHYFNILKQLIEIRTKDDEIQYFFDIDEVHELKFEEIFPILLCEERVVGYLMLPEQKKFYIGVKEHNNPKNIFLIELGTNKIKDCLCPKFDLIEGFTCPFNTTDWDFLNTYFEEWRENNYEDEMFPVVEIEYD